MQHKKTNRLNYFFLNTRTQIKDFKHFVFAQIQPMKLAKGKKDRNHFS